MSGTNPAGGNDPSMEDILASIRRILNEDDANPAKPREPAGAGPSDGSDVFALDASMLVPEPPSGAASFGPASPGPASPGPVSPGPSTVRIEPPPVEVIDIPMPPRAEPPPLLRAEPIELPPPAMPPRPTAAAEPRPPERMPAPAPVPEPTVSIPDIPSVEQIPPSWPASLMGPEAAAAAALSVGSLRRTLEAGRTLSVRSGGPTLDDMVREELRPVLKAWLDANLAPIVERLVRAEIERVVGRADL